MTADSPPPVDLDQLEGRLRNAAMGSLRVGEHYGIHLYAGENPVGTTLRASDAAAIVAAVNAAPALIAELRDLRDREAAVRALAGRMRAQGEPYLNDFDRGLVAGYRDAADQIDHALDGGS